MAVLFLTPLAVVLVVALVLNFRESQKTLGFLTGDQARPAGTWADRALDAAAATRSTPQVTFIPDGFTCLSCRENPALPYRVWCAVCTPVSVFAPLSSEPIERGQR